MDEIDFTLDGTRYHLTRDAVIRAMRKQYPGRLQTWAVDVEGVRFPVKQVLAQALQIPTTAFISTRAQDLLRKLDFEVVNLEDDGTPPDGTEHDPTSKRAALELAIQYAAGRDMLDEDDIVRIARRFEELLK